MWAQHAVTSPGGPLTQAEAHAFLGAVCAAALPRLIAGGHYPVGTDAAAWASALYHDLFVDTGDMDAATGDQPLAPAPGGDGGSLAEGPVRAAAGNAPALLRSHSVQVWQYRG